MTARVIRDAPRQDFESWCSGIGAGLGDQAVRTTTARIKQMRMSVSPGIIRCLRLW
jgi:hypothetical protein